MSQLGAQVRHGFAVAREHGVAVDDAWAETIETALRVALNAEGTAVELGTRALQAYLLRSVDQALAGAMRQQFQVELDRAMAALAGGQAPLGEEGLAIAEEHYREFEKEHRQLDLTTLDRQRWRLNAKLLADSFGKGLGAYLGLKELLNPAGWARLKGLDLKTFGALQEALLRGGSLVDKTVAGVDLAFQGYQGYLWLTDAARARGTLQHIAAALAPPPKEPTAP
ncbi:MAG: hypothetical protein HUU35_01285 [Armatimonadetes bacterium]|nr:hypothetical protein [Armatimonadota bacterium]